MGVCTHHQRDSRCGGGSGEVSLARPRVQAAAKAAKPPSSYNQLEREAVEVVKGCINAWRAYDVPKLISYMADDLVYRVGVSEPLQYGREGFERLARRVANG